jgi:hypothetical protein
VRESSFVVSPGSQYLFSLISGVTSTVLNGTRLSTFCHCEKPVSQSGRRGNLPFKDVRVYNVRLPRRLEYFERLLAMTQLLILVPLSTVLVSSKFKILENKYD